MNKIFNLEKEIINLENIEKYFKNDPKKCLDYFKKILVHQNNDNQKFLLTLENVTFKINKNTQILDNINIELFPGSFHALVGENGAGKSTIIKIIVGIIQNYSGKLLIDDKDLKLNESLRENMAFVPDQTNFPSNFNVYEYLYNITKLLKGNKKEEIDVEIDRYLEQFEIEQIKFKNPNKISTGQKQKILLISALLQKPKILILDEPFANLDPTSRYKFMLELQKIQIQNNTSIFLSTHILDEIQEFSNYVTFLKKGKVLLTKKINAQREIIELYRKYYLEKKENNE